MVNISYIGNTLQKLSFKAPEISQIIMYKFLCDRDFCYHEIALSGYNHLIGGYPSLAVLLNRDLTVPD